MRDLYAFLLIFTLGMWSELSFGQNTFDKVYSILQTNCAASGCHDATNYNSFSVTGSKTNVYNSIFEQEPENVVAAAKGDKLIDAGYPARSFLLRKIGHGISNELTLVPGEGDPMPKDANALADADIEIIRQWIIRGAPMTGTVVDEQLVSDYYTNGGVPKIQQPAAPNPSEGFQIHLGPIFMAPYDEHEFFDKYDLKFDEDREITRMDVVMNAESHHFIIYKFGNAAAAASYDEGLRDFNVVDFFNSDTDFIMAWQNDEDVHLPDGTAYFWEQGAYLDLNYHIFNGNNAILATDLYLNIYTQPSGTAQKEMKSALFNNAGLFIPNNNQPVTFSQTESWSSTKSIWNIVSHTHKYGIDYDVWLRNPDGSQGDQVYEGFYNFEYTFNQGFFEWEHPPVRYFEPLLEVKHGLIHKATYQNYGSAPVTFGFTTNDEMMIIYVQYVEGSFQIPVDTTHNPVDTTGNDTTSTAVLGRAGFESSVNVYPNPFTNFTEIAYEIPTTANVRLEAFDMLGHRVAVLLDEPKTAGTYKYRFRPEDYQISPGVFFLKLTAGDQTVTRKVVGLK